MTASYPDNDFASIERSGTAAVLSIKAAWDIRVLLRSLGNVVVSFLAALVAIPLFLLLFGILCFSVWKLGRSKPFKEKLNANNYKDFRLHYEKISKLSNGLEPLISVDLSKKKWFARIFLRQAVKTARILLRHRTKWPQRWSSWMNLLAQ